jgi:hypothetical protein
VEGSCLPSLRRRTVESRSPLLCSVYATLACGPTAGVTRWWVGQDNSILPEPTPSRANRLKTRRLPPVGCALYWAFRTGVAIKPSCSGLHRGMLQNCRVTSAFQFRCWRARRQEPRAWQRANVSCSASPSATLRIPRQRRTCGSSQCRGVPRTGRFHR